MTHTETAVVEGIADGTTRKLTVREFNLLEQSKAEFADGRTFSLNELVDDLDRELQPLGVQNYALTDEQIAGVDHAIAQAARREFASTDEIADVLGEPL